MSEESSLVELESSLESDTELTDTEDETSEAFQKLRFHGLQSDSEDTDKPAPKWKFWRNRNGQQQVLSVQSGDITVPSQTTESKKDAFGLASMVFNWILKFVFFHEKAPLVSVILLTLNVGIFATLLGTAISLYPPDINVSLTSFTIPNHPSQKHWDSFSAAKAGRYLNASSQNIVAQTSTIVKRDAESVMKRSVDGGDCTPQPGHRYQNIDMSRYSTWNLELIYKVRDGVEDNNLLTKERLSLIHSMENEIYNSDGYANVCHKKSGSALCDRLNSVMSSLYPRNSDGSYVYNTLDGFTPNLTKSLLQFKDHLDQALWYTGGQITVVKSTNQIKAKLLRSQLSVGLPLPCYNGATRDNIGEQQRAVFDYYISLVPLFEKASGGELEVIYGGTGLYDYQVDSAIIHDYLLAIASFVLIVIVVFVLSGFSVWLTVLGIYSVFSCFPWAYFVYRIILGIKTLNVLNVVSVFVVIGIGVDDVFVFINTFKQSGKLKSLPLLHQRLGYTILTAGKATFVTSLTTSVAFFANAISAIPAVKQFGIFMGLVVIFCYIQVLIVLPLALHIWHAVFRYCENCCYYPCSLPCAHKQITVTIPHVRLSELDEEEIGTENDNQADLTYYKESESTDLLSERDNNDVTLESNVTVAETQGMAHIVQTEMIQKTLPVEKVSTFLQLTMLHCIARPVLFFQLVKTKFGKLRFLLLKMFCIWVYLLSLILSIGLVVGLLRFSDRPPQLFNSNSNIQKLLDLTGNLTEGGILDCINGCGGSLPYIPPPSTGGGGTSSSSTKPPTSSPPTSKPSHFTPSHSTPAHTQAPLVTTPPHTQAPPVTTPPHTDPPQTPRPPSTTQAPPPVTHPPVTHTTNNGDHTPSAPVTNPPTHTPNSGGEEVDILSNLYSNNVVVNVVFGIKDIKRVESSEFLSNGNYAVQDDSFVGNFTCSSRPGIINPKGAIRAFCRICTNISSPDNGLIMEGNYNCFPRTLLSSSFRCLYYSAQSLPECQPLLRQDTRNVSVTAAADSYYNSTDGGTKNLRYLSMAFKSTTSPNDSPSDSVKDYQQWEDFLSGELSAISEQSGPGELYEGADKLLSSGFQASEKWVEVNIEVLAVDGSLYGICVSILLCMVIIVFLTYNWRVFVAIKLTVLSIVFSLLAMFVVFGWKLGIVEAITLTIVVGNSLDYCIHLCEGYMSATPEHIAYVEQFKFMSGASIRVKRVAASISFVGVSIVSSAMTTILAIIPLLFTTIELFTRFGQILLLNTVLAITYTLVFCSTFLALFGPSDSKFTKARAVNALVTIGTTVVLYPMLLILVLFILSSVGVPILTADGYPLFP